MSHKLKVSNSDILSNAQEKNRDEIESEARPLKYKSQIEELSEDELPELSLKQEKGTYANSGWRKQIPLTRGHA